MQNHEEWDIFKTGEIYDALKGLCLDKVLDSWSFICLRWYQKDVTTDINRGKWIIRQLG